VGANMGMIRWFLEKTNRCKITGKPILNLGKNFDGWVWEKIHIDALAELLFLKLKPKIEELIEEKLKQLKK